MLSQRGVDEVMLNDGRRKVDNGVGRVLTRKETSPQTIAFFDSATTSSARKSGMSGLRWRHESLTPIIFLA